MLDLFNKQNTQKYKQCSCHFISTVEGQITLCNVSIKYCFSCISMHFFLVRRSGVEVAGWTVDREIRVWFLGYPHRVWALWWQGGKRFLRTSRYPCRCRIGTLKTPRWPWRLVPGSRSKLGNSTTVPWLYSWKIAECDVEPQLANHAFFLMIKLLRISFSI